MATKTKKQDLDKQPSLLEFEGESIAANFKEPKARPLFADGTRVRHLQYGWTATVRILDKKNPDPEKASTRTAICDDGEPVTMHNAHKWEVIQDEDGSALRAKTGTVLDLYERLKGESPNVLLGIRVGDFYEFYGDDAKTAAAALEITLNSREDGVNGRVPMAGIPFHSVERYLSRLIAKGFRTALAESSTGKVAA